VGFETYQRILNEAMQELRDSFGEEAAAHTESGEEIKLPPMPARPTKRKSYVSDFQIDTDLEIMFPDEYISNIPERIRLYKELNEIETEEELVDFENKLTDRFGKIPTPAEALLGIVRIKWPATDMGIEKILLKNNLLIANFVSDPESSFYRSPVFISLMNYVNRKQKHMNVKQKGTKLSLTISNIGTVRDAIRVLREMKENVFAGMENH
jgi:transcription-repair coupling factor (superfamily II helicase)